MKRSFFAAAVIAGCTSILLAQGLPRPDVVYQQAEVIGLQTKAGGFGFTVTGNLKGQTVTGKPFSATEERHSVQTLGDGTHIDRTETNQFYRDDQGRTRVERGSGNSMTVTIQDPVAGSIIVLEPASKTAHRLPAPTVLPAPAGAGAGGPATIKFQTGIAVAGVAPGPPPGLPPDVVITRSESGTATPASEDLGTQIINGVPAQGTRTTLTIPAGQIGNDRAIQVVSERWYSSDLQMTVKSSNTDPRFGETTYELTNINRAAPDPSLFLIPPDYAIQGPELRKPQVEKRD